LEAGDTITSGLSSPTRMPGIDQITNLHLPHMAGEAMPSSNWRVVRRALEHRRSAARLSFHQRAGEAVSTAVSRARRWASLSSSPRVLSNLLSLSCPAVSRSQKKMAALPKRSTNWHLLSISFDTERDSPAVLKLMRTICLRSPRWDLVTGDLTEITAIADQGGRISTRNKVRSVHHLRNCGGRCAGPRAEESSRATMDKRTTG